MQIFMQLNERLREIRENAGRSQSDFAQLTGVSLRSQQQYEKGNVSPSAEYLQKLHAAGYDVNYLLTGKRQAEMLSNEDSELLRLWRAAPLLIRNAALNVLTTNEQSGSAQSKFTVNQSSAGTQNIGDNNDNRTIQHNNIGDITGSVIGSIKQNND